MAPDGVQVHDERRRPKQSALHRVVQQHAASFIAHIEARTGGELHRFVKDKFDAFVECGHDKLLTARPDPVTAVLQAVQRLVTCHLLDHARGRQFGGGYLDQSVQIWAEQGSLPASSHQRVYFKDR